MTFLGNSPRTARRSSSRTAAATSSRSRGRAARRRTCSRRGAASISGFVFARRRTRSTWSTGLRADAGHARRGGAEGRRHACGGLLFALQREHRRHLRGRLDALPERDDRGHPQPRTHDLHLRRSRRRCRVRTSGPFRLGLQGSSSLQRDGRVQLDQPRRQRAARWPLHPEVGRPAGSDRRLGRGAALLAGGVVYYNDGASILEAEASMARRLPWRARSRPGRPRSPPMRRATSTTGTAAAFTSCRRVRTRRGRHRPSPCPQAGGGRAAAAPAERALTPRMAPRWPAAGGADGTADADAGGTRVATGRRALAITLLDPGAAVPRSAPPSLSALRPKPTRPTSAPTRRPARTHTADERRLRAAARRRPGRPSARTSALGGSLGAHRRVGRDRRQRQHEASPRAPFGLLEGRSQRERELLRRHVTLIGAASTSRDGSRPRASDRSAGVGVHLLLQDGCQRAGGRAGHERRRAGQGLVEHDRPRRRCPTASSIPSSPRTALRRHVARGTEHPAVERPHVPHGRVGGRRRR